ncbi:hypothetical protein QE152_g10199 [Popillia japonica]|uniref:Uncharacterized protein n=1 Tax=Popillia japonica TaxID=7064 RepID=A0AAW1LV49_POPJA
MQFEDVEEWMTKSDEGLENEFFTDEDVEEWMTKSDEGLENEFFTDEEIIGIATKADCGCEDDGDNADMEDSHKIGHEEAKKAAEILLQYVEQQKDSTALDVMNIIGRDEHTKMEILGLQKVFNRGSQFARPVGFCHTGLTKRLKDGRGTSKLGRFRHVFASAQEEEIYRYWVELDKRFFGLSLKSLRYLFYVYAKKNGISSSFSDESKMAGRDFTRGFMRRWKLSLRIPRKHCTDHGV